VKVLLIDPPFYRLIGFYNRYFPLGLATVGTVLRDAGHEVWVCDADFNENPTAMDYRRLPERYPAYLAGLQDAEHPVWREIRETVERCRPDMVGISLWTTYAASAFHVAAICKTVSPVCSVVVGGPHATVRAEETLRICPAIDYVVRGEGEATSVELAKHLTGGGPGLEAIAGLSFRCAGDVVHNPSRHYVKNLDEVPLPDRSLLINGRTYSSEDMGLIMTTRGCPFSCSFCATETRQVRCRSIERVVAEIKAVKAAYGTTQFSFKDDSFTVNKSRVAAFCDALRHEGLRIGWECNTRVDLVTEDLLVRMKNAGCNSIKVGVESGSDAVLARMNKGITLDQARRAAALFRKVGIHWTGYFLMGTPGETVEDVYRTLDFMYEIRPDFASIGVYEPFPGTPIFDEGIRRGLVKPDMTWADFRSMLPNHYYKVDPRRQVETIEPQAYALLEREMKDRFHKYNKQYGRLLNRARSRMMQYVRSPRALYGDFQKYLSWR
jgi:anaerobic magnesium-protoporphyrin IX monomethyl ester cyclase